MIAADPVWPWYYDPSLPGDVSFGGSAMGTMFAPVGGISWGGVVTDLATDILGGAFGTAIGTAITRSSPGGSVSTIPQRSPMSPVYAYPGIVARATVIGHKKYKRMNACNPKALKRAIRRVKRFEHFAKQSIKIAKKVKAPRRKTCR